MYLGLTLGLGLGLTLGLGLGLGLSLGLSLGLGLGLGLGLILGLGLDKSNSEYIMIDCGLLCGAFTKRSINSNKAFGSY